MKETVLLGVLFLTPVAAMEITTSVEIAQQQPRADSQDPNRATTAYAKGKQLLEQAEQLLNRGTAASRQQAIAKSEEALSIWREIGDRGMTATTLLSIGTLYYTQEPQKALEYYNQALVIRRELKDRFGEAIMLSSIGGAYSNLGEKQKALLHYNQALSLFRAERKPDLEAQTSIRIGGVYFDLGETQKALASYNQALSIQRTQQDVGGQADTLQTLGRVYTSLGEPQKALDSLNQALALQRPRNDLSGQARTLTIIGSLYNSLGENQLSLESFNQALALQRAAQGNLSGTERVFNLSQQALILMGIASGYKSSGDYQQALNSFNQARSLLQTAGNRSAEAETLNQISLVYNELGEKQLALDSLNQALKLQRAAKDRAREAFTLRAIGGIHNSLGEPQKALDFLNQALELQRQVNDRPQTAVTLKDIADVYSSLGDYQLSVDTYTQALKIFNEIGDRTSKGQTLDNIGSTYRLAGDNQKALEYYSQALLIWREQGDFFREVGTLTGAIRTYESLGDYPKGLDAANQALAVSRQQNSSFGEAAALALMGRVYLASGNYQQALDTSNQALKLLQKLGIRIAEANILGNIGKVYSSLKQPQDAIATYNQELKLRQALGDRTGEAETLYNIAVAERDRGSLNAARPQIETVIKIVEDIRTKVKSQDLRTSYFALVQKYYHFYIDLLMQMHKQQPSKGYDALALQASERARARSLLEILVEANADIRQGVEPKLLERERSLQQQLDAKEKRQLQLLSGQYTEAQAAASQQEIEDLLTQYQQVRAQIRATSPRYAALTQPSPLTLSEIQSTLLDHNTLLLEYSLGEERSYLWAVTKTGLTSYELPKRAEIEAAAQRFRNALTAPTQRTRPGVVAQASATLSQLLLGPVAEQLGQKRLAIVGDGALQYVPFAALSRLKLSGSRNSYEPLAIAHEIVTLPSASTLAVLRQDREHKRASKTVAVLADPVFSRDDERVKSRPTSEPSTPRSTGSLFEQQLARSAQDADITFQRLPFTRQEAEQILSLVPAKERSEVLDFAASRAKATSPELSQYRIVHFATHGILNSVHPELSGLVLSLVDEKGTPQNGFLRLHDIFNLNLPVELVVLSACQTGLGEEVKGEGLVGLTRGFMYAGTPRVVVSLWSVDDEATAQLMTKFYKKMLQEGLKPAAALRASQIEMWQQQQWQAPYYWAAFTLQGEWR